MLRLVAAGRGEREIAHELGLGLRTVRRAWSLALRKCRAESTRQAAAQHLLGAAYQADAHTEEVMLSVWDREARIRQQRTRVRNREWVAANPERHAHNVATRRARKAGNGGSHTLQEWREKCELFANLCAYCGEARPLTRDHKIPLVRGGTDDISNIVPACRPCNSRKGTGS